MKRVMNCRTVSQRSNKETAQYVEKPGCEGEDQV